MLHTQSRLQQRREALSSALGLHLPVMRQIVQDLHHQNEAGLFAALTPSVCVASICHSGLEDCCMLLSHSLPLQGCQSGADLYACVGEAIIQTPVLLLKVILQIPILIHPLRTSQHHFKHRQVMSSRTFAGQNEGMVQYATPPKLRFICL